MQGTVHELRATRQCKEGHYCASRGGAISSVSERLACSLVLMVSMGYRAVSTDTPAAPPANMPSAEDEAK